MRVSEYSEQVAIIEWVKWQEKRYPELQLLFHIPSGEYRHIATAMKLKKMGVRAGLPDLCLPVPRGGYSGLFIELKVLPNKVTPAQKEWIQRLTDQGYYVAVCYGAEPAIRTIKQYLQLPDKGDLT